MLPPSTPTDEQLIATVTSQESVFNTSDIVTFSSPSLVNSNTDHSSGDRPSSPSSRPLLGSTQASSSRVDRSRHMMHTGPPSASSIPYPDSSSTGNTTSGVLPSSAATIMSAHQAPTTSTSTQPTIVMPKEWTVPSYLQYSIFYDRFTVASSSSSSVAILSNNNNSNNTYSASSSFDPSSASASASGSGSLLSWEEAFYTSVGGPTTATTARGSSSNYNNNYNRLASSGHESNWGPPTIHPPRPAYMGPGSSSNYTSLLGAPSLQNPSSIAAATAASTSSSSSSSQGQSAQQLYTERILNPHSQIPLPTKLDPKHCCKRLLIQDDILQFCPEKDDQGRDKLNRHDPDKDAAAVRADHPIPPQAGVYYFEVQVISNGQKGYIGIGFSSRAVDLERLPGWNPESYGYHGDDGKAFACSGTGTAYSERFGSGDTIGCGIDFLAKRAFFVKNGKWLGYVFDLSNAIGERDDPTLKPGYGTASGLSRRDREKGKLRETPGTAPLQLYPTIGLQTPGETVKINFGQEPFQFDINSFVKRRQREMTTSILSTPIPSTFKQALAPGFPQLPNGPSNKTTPSTSTRMSSFTTPGFVSHSDVDDDDPHLKACLQNLVASYLNHRGYSDTARSFRKQRQEERTQWKDLITQSAIAASTSTVAGVGGGLQNGDSASNEASGTQTPVKKKSKKKGETSSKKLLKSALRTTLAPTSAKDDDDSQMDTEEVQEGDSLETSRRDDSGIGGDVTLHQVPDDLLLSDVKGKGAYDYHLDADEAELMDTLRRQDVCAALRRGNIDYAMQQLDEHYPAVLHPSPDDKLRAMLNGNSSGKSTLDIDSEEGAHRRAELLFRLRCRNFVELVLASAASAKLEDPSSSGGKDAAMEGDADDDEDEQVASQLLSSNGLAKINATAGNSTSTVSSTADENDAKAAITSQPAVSLEQVLQYGAKLNSLYPAKGPNVPPRVLAKLKTVFSLVAYADPADLSSHGNIEVYNLTRQEERDELAEVVNKAMLESKGQPGIPHLELVHRQAFAVRNALGDVFGVGAAALVGDVVTV